MKSVIKYFGGKNGFANEILKYFPDNYSKMNMLSHFVVVLLCYFIKKGRQ